MAKLIIVEDEPDIRQGLHDGLVRLGHKVDVASNATEALGLCDNDTYDVAVIDYVLPGTRGLELLHQMRERNPFLKAIVMSGQIDHDTLNAADLEKQLRERIVADKYLPKPTSIDALATAIEELLVSAKKGDWRQLATDAAASQGVTPSAVSKMDQVMRKNRKKSK